MSALARLVPLALLAAPLAPAAAQHALAPAAAPGGYDASVPTPQAVLRYELGDRFTQHADVVRYLERLAAASPRVRVDTLGRTYEGRAIVMAVVTSPANHARLAEIRQAAQRLGQATEGAAELGALAARTPAVAWLGFTVHGNEASGTEASLGVLYQLAAGQDAETRTILDSTVVLIDPIQNPDGHERHVQDNLRMRGAFGVPTTPGAMVHSGNWPGGRTSHYQFDLNRDWFILSHPESRARVATFNTWWPHVAVDLHEMGSNSTYFFSPPMEPLNKNVHGTITKWWDIYAAENGEAFDRTGTAYFRREGYDEFYPGYGVSWPSLMGAVGMTYEQASSAGGAIRRTDGSVLTLREAATNHYTAAMATLRTTATRRAERLRDFVDFRRSAVTEGARSGMRYVAFGGDGQGRADSLAQLLLRNGIAVGRLRQGIDAPATRYGATGSSRAALPAGTYVVDLAQPQGRLAKALLEPDAQLDSSFIAEELESRRTGRSSRFYDVTGWSLPLAYRVPAWTTSAALGALDPVTTAPAGQRSDVAVTATAPQQARHGYAFEAGSLASIRLLAGLLADGVRVWHAPRAFSAEGRDFPHGAFVVRTAANDSLDVHATVRRHAAGAGAELTALSSALVDRGTDLGSNSVVPVRAPRVALLGGQPVSGNSFGFAWYAFDQRIGYPTTAVDAGAIAGGILREFDVLVIPSVGGGALDAALGEGGRERLQQWVRDGGVLIALENAAGWLAREASGLSGFRARPAAGADSAGAPLPANVPGAVLRVLADTLSPLLAGVHDVELPVLVQGDRAFAPPRAAAPGSVVLRYAPAPRLRVTGYLWPEAYARHAGAPYLWTERAGRGRVIAFAGDPNFRDLWHGLLPIFANAVFLGGTF